MTDVQTQLQDIQVFNFADPANRPKKVKKAKAALNQVNQDKDEDSKNADSDDKSVPKGDVIPHVHDLFNYEMLLYRAYNCIKADKPELANEKKKAIIKTPHITKLNGKKCLWGNFGDICDALKRVHEHVMLYVTGELCVEGCINEKSLLIKEKISGKQVESTLTKYIGEYVTCNMCQTLNTNLEKDANSRFYILKCNACKSTRTVAPIKAGFRAVTKDDRKK